MKAHLVVLPSGKQVALEKERTTIGRSKKNDIIASAGFVSSTHCALIKQGASYVIEDLNSSNGTFINGTRIKGIKLRNATMPNTTILTVIRILFFRFIGSPQVKILSFS